MARKRSVAEPTEAAPVTVGSSPEEAASRILSDAGDEAGGKSPRSPAAERQARHRERKRREAEDESPIITVDESDIAEAAVLGSTVWELAMVPMLKMKPLSDEQSLRLGKSLAPIVKKYMPMLGGWQYEVALALTLVSLVTENRQPKQAKEPDPVPTSVLTAELPVVARPSEN